MLQKVYFTIPDPGAEQANQIRVIDESGEDYLYPAHLFVPIDVPPSVTSQLAKLD